MIATSITETDAKENAVRIALVAALQALVLLMFPVALSAQQQLVNDPEIYEKDHFRNECKVAAFGDEPSSGEEGPGPSVK